MTISKLDDFYFEAARIMESFRFFVDKYGLKCQAKADHMGYCCATAASFETIRGLFEKENRIVQSIISERRVALIQIRKQLITPLGRVSLIELLDQRPDFSQSEGFRYIGAVPVLNLRAGSNEASYAELAHFIRSKGLILKEVNEPLYPTLDVEVEKGFSFKLTREPLLECALREIRAT